VDGTPEPVTYLDMTVCCRSNDIVWGAYGANIVHFSFLQEYIAGRLGMNVGTLYQFSNNWHGYMDVLERIAARFNPSDISYTTSELAAKHDPYMTLKVQPMAIGTNWREWMNDLIAFMDGPMELGEYKNPWFSRVAKPMFEVHSLWKRGERNSALAHSDNIAASDWGLAVRQWMERRLAKKEAA
jgi:hypothetical protein